MSLRQAIHRHLLWWLMAAYAIAVVAPGLGLWLRDATLGQISLGNTHLTLSVLFCLLASLRFNAGLGIAPAHLHAVSRKTVLLLAGLLANLMIPMAYIFLVTVAMRGWHEPEEVQHILVGLALVAAMPIAGSSTAWAQNSNGNLVLSLGLLLASTALSPIVTPAELNIFSRMASEQYRDVLHHVADYGSAWFLGLWVVCPAILGIITRMIMAERVALILPAIKDVNAIVLLILNYSNASVSLPQTLRNPDVDFLLVTLSIALGLCLALFGAGYVMSRMLKVEQPERVSLMYGLGMNNNGSGLVLASVALAAYPRVMVPMIFYNLVQHLVAGTVHEALERNGHNQRRRASLPASRVLESKGGLAKTETIRRDQT